MFGKLLRKLGLGEVETKVADTILTGIADKATGGAASKAEDAVKAVGKAVKKRKKG